MITLHARAFAGNDAMPAARVLWMIPPVYPKSSSAMLAIHCCTAATHTQQTSTQQLLLHMYGRSTLV